MENDDDEMQVLSKAYMGRLAQIFEQSQHLPSASHITADTDAVAESNHASAQAIAAMVSDGPALGLSAGTAMSAEITEFLQGMEESERACTWTCSLGQ
jgi:GINS complex subunit 3